MKKLSIWLLILFVLAAFVPAQAQESGAGGTTFIRFVHAAAEAPAIDLIMNGQVVYRSLLESEITEWYAIEPGTYTVAMTTAGASENDAFYRNEEVEIETGEWITIAAVGQQERGHLTATVIRQNLTAEVPADQAQVTVLHAMDGVLAVHVFLNGKVGFAELAFPGGSGTNDGAASFTVAPGNYDDFQLILSSNGENVFSRFPGLDYVAGIDYFVAVSGTDTGGLQYALDTTNPTDVAGSATAFADLTAGQSEATQTFIRAAHLSPDAIAVDLYVDGEVVASNLTYPAASDWVAVEPGDHEIMVVPAGASRSDAIFGPVPTFTAAGSWITTIVYSSDDTLNGLITTERLGAAPEDRAVVTFAHAAPAAAAIKVRSGETSNLVTALGFPGSMGDNDGLSTVLLDPGTYDLNILLWDSGDGTPLFTLEGQAFEAGKSYFVGFVGGTAGYVITETALGGGE